MRGVSTCVSLSCLMRGGQRSRCIKGSNMKAGGDSGARRSSPACVNDVRWPGAAAHVARYSYGSAVARGDRTTFACEPYVVTR